MKKNIEISIFVIWTLLLLCSCGNKTGAEPTKAHVAVVSEAAVTETPASTPTPTNTPTPSPTPSPTPLPKHYQHEAVSSLNCLLEEGSIIGIYDLPDGKLLATTLIESNDKSNILIVDPEKDKIVKRGVTQNAFETYKGYNPDRGYVFLGEFNQNLHVYSEDLLFVEGIKSVDECAYSPEEDAWFDNISGNIVKKGLDGSEEVLLNKAFYTNVEFNRAFSDYCIISAPGHYNNDDREYLKLSFDGKYNSICEGSYSSYSLSKTCFIGETWQDNDDNIVSIYGLSDGKLRGEYLLADYTDFNTNDQADTTLAFVRIFDEKNGTWQLKYYLFNPEDGSFTDSEVIEDVCGEFADYDDESGHWFLAVTQKEVSGKQSKNKTIIYEICPEALEFENRLDYAELENRDPEFGKVGQSHKKIREKADKLEKKYGITIMIGNEIEGWRLSDWYVPVSTENPDAYSSYDTMFTETALEVLEDGLAYYPEGFFEGFKDFRNEGGIRIVLVDALRNEKGTFFASGENNHFGLWNNIIIDVNYIEYITLHHELWHAVEYIIGAVNPDAFDEDNWKAMNPKGFKFVENFDNYMEMSAKYAQYVINPDTPDDSYFGRDYGMVNSKEDRATLVETFIGHGKGIPVEYDNKNLEYLELFPHMKEKMDYMAEMCEKYFGMRYW